MLSQEMKSLIISRAILAPSADNSQPWLFEWHDSCLRLSIDPERSGASSDTRYYLSDIATGAALENIHIFLNSQGIFHRIELLPDPNDPRLVASIDIDCQQAGLHCDETLARLIPLRQTNRHFPFKPFPPRLTAKLIQSAMSDMTSVVDCSDQINKKLACKALLTAESLRFTIRSMHKELYDTIRRSSEPKSPDGMDLDALNIEKPARPLFMLAKNWTAMRIMNRLGMSFMFGFRSTVIPVKLSPALLYIAPNHTDRHHIIALGRALERCWLTATSMGLAVQPYAAPGVFSSGNAPAGGRQNAINDINHAISTLSKQKEGGLFLRIGTPPQNSKNSRTGRRNLTEFIQNQ